MFRIAFMFCLCVGVLGSGSAGFCAEAARAAIPAGVPTKTAAKATTVKADYAQLYSCGARTCDQVGRLERGERLNILESIGEWRRVRSYDSGASGWANAKDLNEQQQYPLAEVLDEYVEVRSCTKVKRCTVKGRLLFGEVVFVLKCSKSWTQIKTKDESLEGWVKSQTLRRL